MRLLRLLFFGLVLFIVISPEAGAITPEMLKKIDQMKQAAVELMDSGKFNKAIPILQDILTMNPADKVASRYLLISKQQIVEPYCKQAAEAYSRDDYPRAIDLWNNILLISPDDRRVTALIEYTKTLVQDKNIDSTYALIEQLFKEERYEDAVNELEKLLTFNPDETRAVDLLKSARKAIIDRDVKVHYDKADQFMKQKRYDLAIEEWREVLKIDVEQEAASRLMATTIRQTFLDSSYGTAEKLYVEGDYVGSAKNYNMISLENPTDQYVKKIISRLNNVLKIVQRVDKQGPDWDMVRKSISNYISLDGSQRIALAAAWYAVQLAPDNNMAVAVRDFLEHELITVVRSMEYPVKDMNIVDQYLFAALNNIYGGRYDLAIQECSIVIELQPRNLLAMKRLGSAYFAMKNKQKAREVWEKALRVAPEDSELKKFISQAR